MLHGHKSAPDKLSPKKRYAMYELLYGLQHGCCHKCKKQLPPFGEYVPPHHPLIHNNSANRKKYPVLVHHAVNQVLLCGDCHYVYPYYMQIPERMARAVENYIMRNPYKTVAQLKEDIYREFYDSIRWCK